MIAKSFKTIDEQLNILRNKGLTIDDENFAKDILIRENYFFLSGYRHLFLKSSNDRNFINGTNFRELYAMFSFDRQIRNIMFKNLLIIENNLKSVISYQLSKKYGFKEKDYLKSSNFNMSREKSKQVNDLIKKIKRQIRVNGSQHSATVHYINYYGFIPFWVVVKVLSFGIVCELFSIMKYEDQKDIASVYGISVENLLTYLPILANYRNLCAHEDLLYNHKTLKSIDNTKYHHELDIPQIDNVYIYGKNDLFALLIILKFMLREEEFNLLVKEIKYEVDILDGKLNVISIDKVLDKMGFPKNYEEIVRMK